VEEAAPPPSVPRGRHAGAADGSHGEQRRAALVAFAPLVRAGATRGERETERQRETETHRERERQRERERERERQREREREARETPLSAVLAGPAEWSSAMNKLRIVTLGYGTGRQRMALER
jgi:hypothetical protein